MMEKTKVSVVLMSLVLALAFLPSIQAQLGGGFEPQEDSIWIGDGFKETRNSETQDIEWLVMVYVALDNNIWPLYYLPFLLSLQLASPTDNVEVIILADGQIDGDTMLMRSTDGLEVLRYPGELNMGDPSSLRYLVDYAMSSYDAEKTLLFIMDHGGSWRGSCVDESGISEEEKDMLTMPEFRTALEGYHFDVLLWDACEMGSLEVAYEVKDLADYMIASEETVMVSPVLSMNVFVPHQIIGALEAEPDMDPRELCEVFFDFYDLEASAKVSGIYKRIGITQAYQAVDLSKVDDIAVAVDDLGDMLFELWPEYKDEITQTRKDTKGYMAAPERYNGALKMVPLYVDLYDLADNLERALPVPGMEAVCEEVKGLLSSAVIATEGDERSHGLSINFPSLINENPIEVYESLAKRYSQLKFAEFSWDEFLNQYIGIELMSGTVEEDGEAGVTHPVEAGEGNLIEEAIAGLIIGGITGGALIGFLAWSIVPTLAMLIIGGCVALFLKLNALTVTVPDLAPFGVFFLLFLTYPMLYGMPILLISSLIGILLGFIGLVFGYALAPLWTLIGGLVGFKFGIPPEGILEALSAIPSVGPAISDMVKAYKVLWLYLPIPTFMVAFFKTLLGNLLGTVEMMTQRAILEPILTGLLPQLLPLLDIWLPLSQAIFSIVFGLTGAIRDGIGAISDLVIGGVEAVIGASMAILSLIPMVGDELSEFISWMGAALVNWLENVADYRGLIP